MSVSVVSGSSTGSASSLSSVSRPRPYRPVGSYLWVLGSRSLSPAAQPLVQRVVASAVHSGLGIGSGGALGADLLALQALLSTLTNLPPETSRRILISSPLRLAFASPADLPESVRALVRQLESLGGRITWGPASRKNDFSLIRSALLERSRALSQPAQCVAAVAFLGTGPSAGSAYSLNLLARRKPVYAFLCGADKLPTLLGGGSWQPASLVGLPCYRWHKRV